MIPGFGKHTITIGSAPQCDVVLAGQGIAPEHARITHQGGGKLLFIPTTAGAVVGDRQLNPGEQAPFDFRTQFYIHQIPVPLNHPALTLMLLAKGQIAAPPGQIIIGRDPARASIVLQHPSVSSQHATVVLDRMMVIDHSSTSGTFVGKSRIPGGTPTPLNPQGIVAFGPVPVQVALLGQLAQAISGGFPAAGDPAPGSMPGAARPAAPGTAALPSTGGYPVAPGPVGPPPAVAYPSGPHAQASAPHAQPSGAHAAPVMAGAGIRHGPIGAPAPGPAPGPGQPGTAAMPVGGGAAAAAAGQPGTSLMQMGQMGGPSGGFSAPAAGSTPRKKNKTVLGHLEFSAGQQPVKTIGRTPDNNIVLNHAQVSSRHALLHQIDGRFFLEDRGSANGTYVRGQRIPSGQKIAVQSGEKIYIGPMPLQIELSGSGAADIVQEEFAPDRWAGKPLYEIEAWSLVLQVSDRDNPREMKTILDDVSFKALPGDMIALMGPSGAGKTTLLLALNGYLPPSSGMVRINGEDLYNIYDNLRGSIGYVPQDDLVHPELTVFEAVRYSAKFRLPPDYTDDEIDARVEQTIRDLGLEGVKNLQIGKPERKILSGGQRKRVNIALELVTDPVILFLDEPTSGLAADDTTALITLLADLTKATGKTIIMTIHQPAKDEFEKFNNCLIMGYGGVPMFFGPSKEAYGYFGRQKQRSGQQNDIDNPRDMFEMIAQRERPIYEALLAQNPNASRGQARQLAAVEWRKEFYQPDNPIFRKMYSGRREVGTGQGQRGIPATRAKTSGQLRLLLSRYFKVKIRDTWGTVIMLAQAPIIGVLLAIVFGGQKDAIPAWCLGALQELSGRAGEKDGNTDILAGVSATSDNTGAIFFLVVAAVWFGTSNAAREIVSERAIYLRERMVNLGLVNYVLSKYVLLAMFCIVQCAVLLGIVFFTLKFHGGWNAFAMQLAALTATAFVAVAIGLLISTLVESSEAAMALTPIALIPQVVLGGLIVPSTTIPHLAPLMYAIPARWGFEGAVTPEKVAVAGDPSWSIEIGDPTVSSPPDFVENGVFDCSIAQLASDNFAGGWGFTTYDKPWVPYAVLGGMAVVAMILLCIILKRRDPV